MTPANQPPEIAEDRLQAALARDLLQLDIPDLTEKDRTEIYRILQENWQRGRMQKFLEGDLERLPDYVRRVVDFWMSDRDTVHSLQIERADDAWRELHKKMVSWNYRYLVGQGAYLSDTHELAEACATEAIPVLQSAHFPFDVPFEAWVRVIALNVCRKQVRVAKKKSAIPPGSLLELDALPQELPGSEGVHSDLRLDLVEAFLSLNASRQEVMRLIYVDGLTVSEVAEKLGRTHSSVYNLHFQSVRELRKLMHNWVNDD